MSEQDEKVACFVSYKKVDGQWVQEWEGPAEMKCYYRSDNYVVETKVEQADCSNTEKYLFHTHKTSEGKSVTTLTPGG